MSRRGIVSAGNWLIDTVKTLDRWPPEGELAQVLQIDRAAGGACNLLFDLAKLQTDLPLWGCGCVGDDDGGRWLSAELERLKIRNALRTIPGGETAGTDVMSVGGKRTFFYNAGCNRSFSVEDLVGLDVPAKIVYLAYILLLPLLDEPDPDFGTGGARALAALRQKGFLTAVDLVSAAPERFMKIVPPALPHIDIFVINEVEAGNLCGLQLRNPDGTLAEEALLEKAARKLLELGVHELAAIHYPEGCVAVTRRGEYCSMLSCPMEKKDIVGTNGAGDAFFAGLLYAYHEEKSLPDMIRYASASARFNLRCATANGGAPALVELEEFLRNSQW